MGAAIIEHTKYESYYIFVALMMMVVVLVVMTIKWRKAGD